jgi:hypothetical protein
VTEHIALVRRTSVVTTTETTNTYTCDLCGTEVPRDELHRFGLVQIHEGEVTYYSNPETTGDHRVTYATPASDVRSRS